MLVKFNFTCSLYEYKAHLLDYRLTYFLRQLFVASFVEECL